MNPILLTAIGAFSGACLGSFTTMLVWRLHHDLPGIMTGRSQCPHCHKKLQAWNLIPIFSWLFQRGRCAFCQKPISAYYPLTELSFAIAGAIFVPKICTEVWWMALLGLVLVFAAMVMWTYDVRFFEVDRRISWPAIVIAAAWGLLHLSPESVAIGGAIGFGFFALQYWGSGKKWVGAGDLDLGAVIGLALGWKMTLLALMISYLLGSLVAIPLLAGQKYGWKSMLPMGAFLMPGFLLMLHSGDEIWQMYLSWIGM